MMMNAPPSQISTVGINEDLSSVEPKSNHPNNRTFMSFKYYDVKQNNPYTMDLGNVSLP